MSWLTALLAVFTLEHILSGVLGGAAGALIMFALGWWRDRSLASHKEELGRVSSILTNQMTLASNQTLEHLRKELGFATEAYKSDLKKREWLFEKELDAAKAFIALKTKYVPSSGSFEFDADDAARTLGRRSMDVQSDLETFRAGHFPVLPEDIRREFDEALSAFSYGVSEAEILPSQEQIENRTSNAGEALHSALMRIERLLVALVRS